MVHKKQQNLSCCCNILFTTYPCCSFSSLTNHTIEYYYVVFHSYCKTFTPLLFPNIHITHNPFQSSRMRSCNLLISAFAFVSPSPSPNTCLTLRFRSSVIITGEPIMCNCLTGMALTRRWWEHTACCAGWIPKTVSLFICLKSIWIQTWFVCMLLTWCSLQHWHFHDNQSTSDIVHVKVSRPVPNDLLKGKDIYHK